MGAPVEVFGAGEPRPLAGDEVLLEVMAAGVGNWDEFVRVGGWDVGTGAPMLIAPAELLARKPHGVSWQAVAAFPIPALTAEQVLSDALRVRAGEQRGVTVYSVYVRPDGRQLRDLATRLAAGQLEIPVAASYRLADAARALAQVVGGHAGGAVVLAP